MRLGIHGEADYFRKAKPWYEALIINANLVQATPAASAALVYSLEKPFLIDPFTHSFGLLPKYVMSQGKGKNKASRVKRSFAGLASNYFSNADFLGKRALEPADVNAEELSHRVLEFQENVLFSAVDELASYFPNSERLRPTWLIAPYFPLRRRTFRDWLPVNLECLKFAKAESDKTCALIPIEFGVLREACDEIVDTYTALKPDTVFMWIDQFDEDRASDQDLELYCRFVSRIAAAGVKPIAFFGGFFSCIAQCLGLAGFAHGLVYGENKSFTPVVGGGQPPPRYYLKPAHISMNVREAELLLANTDVSTYLGSVCNCTICTGLFKGQSDLTNFAQFSATNDQGKFMPRAYALCRYHFLFDRHDEITTISPLSREEREKYLQDNIACLTQMGADQYSDHLVTWINVMKKFC